MAFFKTEPNVAETEKAKVEFYLQHIAESVGADRLKLPVLSVDTLKDLFGSNMTLDQMVAFVGEHLAHDVNAIQLVTEPKPIEKCGSGG